MAKPVSGHMALGMIETRGLVASLEAADAMAKAASVTILSQTKSGGGLVATAGDYLRFLQMMLNGGELDGVRVLQPESVALMTQNQIADMRIPFAGHGDGFGFGFGVVTDRGADADSASYLEPTSPAVERRSDSAPRKRLQRNESKRRIGLKDSQE